MKLIHRLQQGDPWVSALVYWDVRHGKMAFGTGPKHLVGTYLRVLIRLPYRRAWELSLRTKPFRIFSTLHRT